MAAPQLSRPASEGQTPDPVIDSVPSKSSLAADASPSNPEVLCTLYSAMLKTRLLEEQVLALFRAGRIPGVPLPILGGEATEVGACVGLQPDDAISSSQPNLATHVVMDTPLKRVFGQLFNVEKAYLDNHPSSESREPQVIPLTVTIAGQFDIAAGVAFAYRQLEKSNVVVALADDGLAALGCWHEAASLAAHQRLPIVFIIENSAQSHGNGTAVVKYDGDLRDRAEAYGFPGITVDGNDIVAVWRVTQESIHRARSGAGPTLIECRTWRWHAEADRDSNGYGAKAKLTQGRKTHDPLHHMEHYMKKRSLWQPTWKDRLAEEYRAALEEAVAFAEASAHSR
jgi:TPP-dependent pyruvate/acetoin dehydrogenase alpha subunit